jgi:GalNAc-alpha-(1->4)-GalNAc-alpha-(1->3)-diNAcBac-PP-undecaprenol alpha-1,4-N-acetyl-D-galactosaminyltransferase
MNIVFQLSRLHYGGGERVLMTLMEEFINRGVNVTCITWNKEIVEASLPFKVEYFKLSKKYNRFSKYKTRFRQIKDFLKRNNIDLLVLFNADTVFYHAAKTCKVKTIYSLRVDLGYFNSYKQKLLFWFALLLANKIVFQTPKIRKQMPKYIQKKSIVIPNPVLHLLPPVNFIREKRIVSVGRLSPEKGHSMLIEAFSEINRDGYYLSIYGSGDLKDELNELIQKLHLESEVHLEGQVDKVINHIANAEIFVLNSNSVEGMPNALIEAMAMGLACISTNFPSGGAEFLIKHNVNGIIIPINNKIELKRALQQLIDNENLRQKLKTNAEKIRQTLAKDVIINQWIDFMKILVVR